MVGAKPCFSFTCLKYTCCTFPIICCAIVPFVPWCMMQLVFLTLDCYRCLCSFTKDEDLTSLSEIGLMKPWHTQKGSCTAHTSLSAVVILSARKQVFVIKVDLVCLQCGEHSKILSSNFESFGFVQRSKPGLAVATFSGMLGKLYLTKPFDLLPMSNALNPNIVNITIWCCLLHTCLCKPGCCSLHLSLSAHHHYRFPLFLVPAEAQQHTSEALLENWLSTPLYHTITLVVWERGSSWKYE